MDRSLQNLIEKLIRQEVGRLVEYAHPRKVFIERVENLFKQIIIHYCLVKYHILINDMQNINHWKCELLGWVENLIEIQIKGCDSIEVRYKAIVNALNNMDYLNDIKQIQRCCFTKMKSEGVNINDPIMIETMKDCQSNLITFAKIIAEKDIIQCNDFIENI